jgi:hypothetical protein
MPLSISRAARSPSAHVHYYRPFSCFSHPDALLLADGGYLLHMLPQIAQTGAFHCRRLRDAAQLSMLSFFRAIADC